MTMIQDIISNHPGFNHVQVKDPSDPNRQPVTIVVEDGKVTSVYDPADPIDPTTRASFSIDPEIMKIIGSNDPSLIEFKLEDADDITADWKEAYTVRIASKIHGWDDARSDAMNRPGRTEEAESELQSPLDPSKIDDVTIKESESIRTARTTMGLTDDQLKTVSLAKTADEDFTPPVSDAEKFVQMACDSKIPLYTILTEYSSGFYLSDLLNAIIDLDKAGEISVVELVEGADGPQYGDIVPLTPINTGAADEDPNDDEYMSDPESLLTYIEEGEDENIVDNSVYADPDDPANYRHAEEPARREYPTNISIPVMPDTYTQEADAETDVEEDDGLAIGTEETTNVEEEAVPVVDSPVEETYDAVTGEEQGVNDAETNDTPEVEEEEAIVSETAIVEPEDPEDAMPADDDDDQGDDTVPGEIHGDGSDDEIEDLVGFVGKAKRKLADLKDRKSEVDGEIVDLKAIDIEETEALITSFEKDRKELEDKISALQDRKSKVLQDILEARRQKAEQEERLSHLDEKEAESKRLAAQINSLASALK